MNDSRKRKRGSGMHGKSDAKAASGKNGSELEASSDRESATSNWRDAAVFDYRSNRRIIAYQAVESTKDRMRRDGFTEAMAASIPDIPRQYVNCSISKCGRKTKYSSHRDWSYILGSTLHKLILATVWVYEVAGKMVRRACRKVPMPTWRELAVVTFVTGVGVCATDVIWTKGNIELGRITTEVNDIHFQISKLQSDNIEHRSENAANSNRSDDDNRKIDTMRHTLCPSCEKCDYQEGIARDGLGWDKFGSKARDNAYRAYNRKNVMEKQRTVDEKAVPITINDGEAPMEPPSKKSKTKGGTIDKSNLKNMDREDYSKFIAEQRFVPGTDKKVKVRCIQRPPVQVGLHGSTRGHCIRHSHFAREFVRRGFFPRIVDSNGDAVKDQILFTLEDTKLLIPGTRVKKERLPLEKNNTANEVCSKNNPGLVCVAHAYKNDPRTFRAWRRFALKLNRSLKLLRGEKISGDFWDLRTEEGIEAMKEAYKSLPELIIHGFSGSVEKADTHAPQPSRIADDDVTFKSAYDQQSDQKSNKVMLRSLEQKRPAAIFMDEGSWGEKFQDKDEIDVDDAIFLGYAQFSNSGCIIRRRNWDEIDQMFAGMEEYTKDMSNRLCLTYMQEDHKCFVLEHLLDQETFAETVMGRRPLQKVDVWEEDTRPLKAPLLEMAEKNYVWKGYTGEKLLDPNVIVPYITSNDIRRFLCRKEVSDEDFARNMGTPMTDDNSTYIKRKTIQKRLSVADAAAIVMYVMGAAALKFFRLFSVNDGYVTPAADFPSDCLSDSHRTSPLPCSNSDFDCNVQFMSWEMRKFVRWFFNDGEGRDLPSEGFGGLKNVPADNAPPVHKVAEGAPVSYRDLDLNQPTHQELLVQCLFMCLACRLTGKTPVLQQFNSDVVAGCHLPLLSDSQKFVDFVGEVCVGDKTIAGVRSDQFGGSLPENICKGNKQNFYDCWSAIANSQLGAEKLRKLLRLKKSSTTRRDVHECLRSIIQVCGDARKGRLPFIASKVLSDVEVVFLGAFGVIEQDTVALGVGGEHGLECINLNGHWSKTERFLEFHRQLVAFLTDDAREEAFLTGCGWMRNSDGNLESLFSGRLFSLADTEHILCKVWLTVVHSSTCRNITFSKEAKSDHTHPLPREMEWEEKIRSHMREILLAMVECAQLTTANSTNSVYGYPSAVLFEHEINKQSKKRKVPFWFTKVEHQEIKRQIENLLQHAASQR